MARSIDGITIRTEFAQPLTGVVRTPIITRVFGRLHTRVGMVLVGLGFIVANSLIVAGMVRDVHKLRVINSAQTTSNSSTTSVQEIKPPKVNQ